MYQKSKQFADQRKSKFIFTGKEATDSNDKMTHFGFVGLIGVVTLGLWFLVLAKTKTAVYHGYVYINGGPNAITEELLQKINKKAKFDLTDEDKVEIVISPGFSQFLVFTDNKLYYQMPPNSKTISMAEYVFGEIALKDVKEFKVKKNFNNMLDLKINDENIGAIKDCSYPRLMEFVQTIGKELTSNAS
jgi:hypothetical protein